MPTTRIALLRSAGQCVGTAFVVAHGLAVTAAHVVRDAQPSINAGPGATISGKLIFPNEHLISQFSVVENGWYPPVDSISRSPNQIADIALLKFDIPRDAMCTVRVAHLARTPLLGNILTVTGFVARRSLTGTDFSTETIRARLEKVTEVNGWLRASPKNPNTDAGLPGLSGSPAYSERTKLVHGMFAQGQESGRGRWLLIPSTIIQHILLDAAKRKEIHRPMAKATLRTNSSRLFPKTGRSIDFKRGPALVVRGWRRVT